MEIQLPEQIDLSRSEQYVLIFEAYPEQLAFSLHHPDREAESFYYRFPANRQADAFAQFREAFFDHAFFTCPFRKVLLVNHTPVFACVPNLLFEEKDKEEYLQFLFPAAHGKILHQTLSTPALTLLHALPEDLYGFLQRSFPDISMVHHTAALIAWCQEKGQTIDANRMILFCRPEEMDVLCFSRQQLLLSNHFDCESTEDAVYYALYIYKQLKFNQLKDYIYLVEAGEDLQEKLNKYIQNVVPCENSQREIQKSAV